MRLSSATRAERISLIKEKGGSGHFRLFLLILKRISQTITHKFAVIFHFDMVKIVYCVAEKSMIK